ncbi:multidrug and toxin extrusion protein 1-like isoform X1 [Anguilla anguilla]|uniref:multidrug and toxin extrusion protein 1-like isoform X1 n=2 Tax=Anguilla anguilla TaxID=7936 RepID=UPI0015ACCA0E|nr:multidrug and toxin extrusion protein 1-like isoform X1 [Anguilla anguilla]
MEAIHVGTSEMIGIYSVTNTVTKSDSSQQTVYGCLRCLRRGIPHDHKKEIVQLSKLAVPVCIAQLLVFFIPFVSTMFCGHLGRTELAGVGLATAVATIAGISIGSGLASVCDTLMSQTFGSGNLKGVGVILQRGALILLLACCPCWAVLINTESIMLVFKQSPEVARLAQMYVQIFLGALPAVFSFLLLGKYLQCQGIIWPQVITGIVGNVLNALINYIFLFVLDLGVVGSAAANTISQYSLALFLFAYIYCKGLHKPTWGGWSVECLQEWGSFLNLAIPSMLMICLEWWMYDIGSFLTGLINEVELGAQSILRQMSGVSYMFPQGYKIAASVRVGNALGAGNTQQAQLSSKVSIMCTVVMSICIAIIIGTAKDWMAIAFTNDEQVKRRFGEAVVLFIPFHLFDSIACVSGGILRGAAKQKIGAVSALLCYYFVGIPVGVPLMFATELGVTGLWAGLVICVFLLAGFSLAIIFKLDWKKAAFEAQVRAGVQMAEKSDQAQAMKMQGGSYEMTPEIHGGEHSPWQFNSDLEGLHEREGGTLTTVGEVLSNRQLFLRRGLALCGMLVILGAGSLTYMLLPTVFRQGLNETVTIPPTVDNLWTHNPMD